MKKAKKQHKSLLQQIGEYFVAGGAFFWSGYAAFAVFDGLLGWPLFIAKQLANVVGLSINYILEDQWVFKKTKLKSKKSKAQHEHDRRRSGRYILITILNFMIDYLIVEQLKEHGITPYLGQFASAGFFTFWNFVWYKYWVFAPHTSKKKGKRKVVKR